MNYPRRPPLKIAVLVRLFPNIVQTYVLNHILCLKKTGAEIRIVAENNPHQREVHPQVKENDLLNEALYINADSDGLLKQVVSTPFLNRRYISTVTKIIFSDIWKRHGFKYGIKALLRAKVLSENNFDLVHSHSLFSSYHYLFLKELFSIPIITTFHGLVPNNVKMLETGKIRAVLKTGDAFFVNTRFAQKQLVDYGCSIDKIHILPQGTNTQDFPFHSRSITANEPAIILSVGRLSIEKGFHIAVKAIARLRSRFPNIEYRIVGSGPEERQLKELIQTLDLEGAVKLYGNVNTDALLFHYSAAHIFILPSIDLKDESHTETQGVVLQEAQSSGIPVIASRTGGIPEVIRDGETGLLFDEGNDVQLAKIIELLFTNTYLYQSLCLKARKDVEDTYSIDVICNRLFRSYKEIFEIHSIN